MRIFITLTLLLSCLNVFADIFADISVSALNQPIMDQIGLLDAETKASLDNQIRAVYNNKQGPQLAVLIVNTLEGQPIEDVADKVFASWKLGDSKRDDGVLFIVAVKDRKMRIEVGQGLEGGFTDYDTKKVQDRVKPFFKAQDYAGGIKEGVTGILSFIGKPDAVQMPVASVPRKAPERVSTPAEIQAQKDMALLVISILIGLGVTFLIVTRLMRAYRSRKEEFLESESNLQEVQTTDREVKFKFKTTNLASKAEEFQSKAEVMKKKTAQLHNQINEESIKKDSSAKTLFEEKMNEVHSENSRVESLKADISYYKKVIKENK